MEKMNVSAALVQMKCWHGFMTKMNVGITSVRMKCWPLAWLRCIWSVDVTSWLHECWHGFGENEVLTWLSANIGATSIASANANVECCRGFMTKMNVGIASVRMKCWCGFMVKTSIDMTSGMTSALIWSVVMALWQKWIVDVTSGLRYEWGVERWHDFNANEVLLWLHDKDECWHNFDMNEM